MQRSKREGPGGSPVPGARWKESGVPGLLDKAFLDGVFGEAGDVVEVEFFHEADAVGLDGGGGDFHDFGHFLDAAALGGVDEDFEFARGECGFGFLAGLILEFVDEVGGDVGGVVGAAGLDGADGLEEFFGRAFFEEVALGAGFGDVDDVFAGVVDGEDEDFDVRMGFAELADNFEAVHPWHVDVEEDEVGAMCGGDLNRFVA